MSDGVARIAAYVDGFNLYHGLKDARGRRGMWLDLESLVCALLRPRQELVAVHYFTAMVNGRGRSRQQTYLDALSARCPLVTVHQGRFQRKVQRCKGCASEWNSYEEKESDVSLAVQMVEDAANDVYDQAFVVSGDSDMAPAVRSVRRIAPTVRITAVFPPRRSSHDLRQITDGLIRIHDKIPERHQLPETLDHNGVTLVRPDHWR